MKAVIVSMLLVVSAIAEPPVDNRYLPPSSTYGVPSAPSQNYGVPGAGSSRQTGAVFGGRSSFGGSRPSTQYGAPQARQPSSQYGAPNAHSRPSSQYGTPAIGQSLSQLGANLGQPTAQYLPPSSQYGAPSQQYGVPGFGQAGQGQSRQYLPPGAGGRGGYGYDDGSNGEPANYSFEYMVKDDPSGNDFGHKEARQGDRAEGLYYVVLPDGRKQTVEYEADQGGYRPRISYEDTGLGLGGYNRNSQPIDYQGQSGPY